MCSLCGYHVLITWLQGDNVADLIERGVKDVYPDRFVASPVEWVQTQLHVVQSQNADPNLLLILKVMFNVFGFSVLWKQCLLQVF